MFVYNVEGRGMSYNNNNTFLQMLFNNQQEHLQQLQLQNQQLQNQFSSLQSNLASAASAAAYNPIPPHSDILIHLYPPDQGSQSRKIQ